MGILDKLLGRDEEPAQRPGAGQAQSADEQALARYRYMLKTAPPETIEQAHAEAFAKLTPEQRSLLLQQLSADMPEAERARAAAKDDPRSLARMATRAEVSRPGTMERTFGGMGGGRGMGLGGMMAGSFLSTIAGVVVGSAIAQAFLGDAGAGDAGAGDATADHGAGDMNHDTAGDGTGGAGSDVADAGGFDGGGFDGGDFGDI